MNKIILLIFLLLFNDCNIIDINIETKKSTMTSIDILQTATWVDPQGISHQGGLYPSGSNIPTGIQATRLQKATNKLTGQISVVCFGASNCMYEGMEFQSLHPTNFVNCAYSGKNLDKMLQDNYWTQTHTTISGSGISESSIQIAILESNIFSELINTGTFTEYTNYLVNKLISVCQRILIEYPSVKIIYFGGTTSTQYVLPSFTKFNEPWSYYLSWAIKFLIEKQINGDPLLEINGPNKKSPLLSWMIPQWSNGTEPNNFGFSWGINDVSPAYPGAVENGIHPSIVGAQKVANQWLNFFQTDYYTSQWFI